MALSLKHVRVVCATTLFALFTGCFQMDYVVTLEEDLSGEANFEISVDLDRMAYVIANVQRQFAGGEGSPTDEEIAEARADLLTQMDDGQFGEDGMREQIETDLPPGVTLVDATQSREGLRTDVTITLAFDHISSLNQMDVGPDAGPGADAQPFGSFEIVDEGETFVLRTEPMNPVEQAQEGSAMVDGVSSLIETMFIDLRIGFSIDSPFEVVDHNATHHEGSRLSWIYDYEALSSGDDTGMFVRFRR